MYSTKPIQPSRWLDAICSKPFNPTERDICMRSHFYRGTTQYKITIDPSMVGMLTQEVAHSIRSKLQLDKPIQFAASRESLTGLPIELYDNQASVEQQNLIDEFSKDEVVQEILETFPDAEVLSARRV